MTNWQIKHLPICESTMQEAKKMSVGSCVYTDSQTNGRGRLKRKWYDGAGNLMASLILSKPKEPTEYAFLVALAVAQTLSFLPVRIKWPNDILIDDKKVCGILLELGEDKLIVGIGVNILSCPKEKVLYPTTCLKAYSAETTPKVLLESILENFEEIEGEYLKKGFSLIRQKWLEYACGIDEKICVHLAEENKEGIFDGIDETGALVLRCEKDEKQIITAGDIFLIKEEK